MARPVDVRHARHGQAPTRWNTRERAEARFSARTSGEVVKFGRFRVTSFAAKQKGSIVQWLGLGIGLLRGVLVRGLVPRG